MVNIFCSKAIYLVPSVLETVPGAHGQDVGKEEGKEEIRYQDE